MSAAKAKIKEMTDHTFGTWSRPKRMGYALC